MTLNCSSRFVSGRENFSHPLSKSVFMRFRGFTLFDLDCSSFLRLSILLCHNFVPKRSSLPMSPDAVDCWGSGSVTEVTAAGLNIHVVPSADTNTPPSLSTSNTFPVRPRIYKWNKVAYYFFLNLLSFSIVSGDTRIIGSRVEAFIVYSSSFF